MGKLKGRFKKAGRRSRSESMTSAVSASDIPRSSSEDVLGDGVDEDSDTSSTYDEVRSLELWLAQFSLADIPYSSELDLIIQKEKITVVWH